MIYVKLSSSLLAPEIFTLTNHNLDSKRIVINVFGDTLFKSVCHQFWEIHQS